MRRVPESHGLSSSRPDAARARPPRIGVIGSGQAEGPALAAARAIGGAIARAQAVLVCGGLGGVMGAAADGAAAAGGTVLGFLPGEDAEAAAPGVSIPVPTGMGEARNTLVVKAAEAVIAVGGGWGTLNEAALCLKLGIPIVGVLDTLGEGLPIERCADPEAAVARALEHARGRRPPRPGQAGRQ